MFGVLLFLPVTPEAPQITSPLMVQSDVYCFIPLSCCRWLFSIWGGALFDFVKDFIVFMAAICLFRPACGGCGGLLESLYLYFSGFIFFFFFYSINAIKSRRAAGEASRNGICHVGEFKVEFLGKRAITSTKELW